MNTQGTLELNAPAPILSKDGLGNGVRLVLKPRTANGRIYLLKTINKDGNIAEKKFRDENKLVNHLQAMVGNMACKTASITGPDGETDVFKMTRRGWCFAIGYKLPNAEVRHGGPDAPN